MITGKNYIGNVLSSMGDRTFRTFNPVTNQDNITLFTEASEAEINQAMELATIAYKKFSSMSGADRGAFLNAIADEIEALEEALIETYCAESGLPEGRAKGERGRTIFQLRTFADLVIAEDWVEASIDTANPDRTPIPKADVRKMLVPIGPVVVFGASNFPLAYSTAGGDTAAALAAGCPVVVKSHPMHAGTGELIASAIITAAEKTNMPNGVFSNLNSSGIEVGTQLVKHPATKAVGFTGSIGGGRALYDLAASRPEPIPVFAEMGSINPVVILPEALKKKGTDWAKTYAGSITLGAGQFCTNPGLILGIECENLDGFIQTLSEEILKIEPSCMLHPNIHKAFEDNKSIMKSQDGLQITSETPGKIRSNFGRPAISEVYGATFLENPALHLEVFGPFSLVVRCKNATQLKEIVLKLEGQLTGTLIAENGEEVNYPKTIAALKGRVGRIIFNGVPTGVEVCPSMVHGGPYPASTDSRFTAVGINSIKRWVRPFSYQSWPNELLPEALKDENPLGIVRLVDGVKTDKKL